MERDSMYVMGHGHRVCQDYTLSGNDFVVLSDGCSSSPDSDLGARYLCHAAGHRDSLYQGSFDSGWVIRRAARAAATLGNSMSSLDATLLVATADENGFVRCYAAGDGVIAVRMRGGELRVWEIDDGPAPAYLSYRLSPGRMERYWQEWGTTRTIRYSRDGQVRREFELSIRQSYLFQLSFPIASIEAVFLMSDGVKSFSDGDKRPVQMGDVVEEICALRSLRGEFVRRRLGRFLKRTCVSRSWSHDDDISVAAMHFSKGTQ